MANGSIKSSVITKGRIYRPNLRACIKNAVASASAATQKALIVRICP